MYNVHVYTCTCTVHVYTLNCDVGRWDVECGDVQYIVYLHLHIIYRVLAKQKRSRG